MNELMVYDFLAVKLGISIVMIIVNLLIFFKTKEIYDLTNHKGIKHFRRGFLFFAISLFISIFIILFWADNFIAKNIEPFMLTLLLPTSYFFLVAVLNLIYSLIYKKFKNYDYENYVIFGFPIFVVILIAIFRTGIPFIIVSASSILCILTISTYQYFKSRKKKKFSFIYTSYILLVLSFFLGAFPIRENIIPIEIRIFNNFIALILYLLIYYKITKELR